MAVQDEVREQQRASWNKFAPGWKKWDGLTMGFLKPVGEALLEAARLRDGSAVLDVATGTGEPGLTAAGKVGGGKVVGTDLSEEMVRIAAENARARGIANYEARVADASPLPFADGAFDSVICRFGLMFFPDPPAGVREMARVLRKGGRLCVSVWGPPERNPWASLIAKIVMDTLGLPKPPPEAPGIFRFAEPGSAEKLLDAAGLSETWEVPVEGKMTLASPQQYWDLMTEVAAPISGALSQADAPTRERIRARVVEGAARFAADGGLAMPSLAYVVTGTR